MPDIDYEYAYGVACAELSKAKSRIVEHRNVLRRIAEMPHDELGLAGMIAREELERP